MSEPQQEIIEFLRETGNQFSYGGYDSLGNGAFAVLKAIEAKETVWAVILADAYGFGHDFIEKMRHAFGVGKIS